MTDPNKSWPHLEVGTINQHARLDGNRPTTFGPAVGLLVRYRFTEFDDTDPASIDVLWANGQLVIISEGISIVRQAHDEIRLARVEPFAPQHDLITDIGVHTDVPEPTSAYSVVEARDGNGELVERRTYAHAPDQGDRDWLYGMLHDKWGDIDGLTVKWVTP